MKRVILLLPVLLILIADFSFAQRGPEKHGKLRAYMKENVLPVVKEQRLKLEEKLSADEKAKITEAREQLGELREEMKPLHEQMRDSHKSKELPSDEVLDKLHELRKEKMKIMHGLKPVAEAQAENIKQHMEEISDEREQWKNDLQEMRKARHEKMREKHGEDAEHKPRHGHKRGMHGLMRFLKPVGFLLFDPSKDFDELPNEENNEKSLVFPNPSEGSNTLKFSTKDAGLVRVELLDRNGKFIREVYKQDTEAGTHQIKVEGLNSGSKVHFYRITTPSGTETKRFVLR